MRTGDEYSELSELGGAGSTTSSYGKGGSGGGGGGGRDGSGSWSRSRSRTAAAAAAAAVAAEEEAMLLGGVGGGGSPGRGHTRSRSGLYYSPPGTSYTIVERPSSALHHHREYGAGGGGQQLQGGPYGSNSIASPRGTYLGSNPNFRSTTTSGGGSNINLNHIHSSSSSSAAALAAANKKRPISPEQVLRLFNNQSGGVGVPGGGGGGGKIERPRRSPASSPPSTTHNYHHHRGTVPPPPPPPPSYGGMSTGTTTLHELSTRTVTMMREPPEGSHGFGICVKGGKDAGVYISRVEEGSVSERAGLRPGDTILEVNGTPFTGVSHEDALKMLKSCKKLSMTVKSPTAALAGMMMMGGSMGGGGQWPPVRQTCSWMDRQGRPVSPPLEYSSRAGMIVPPAHGQRYGSYVRSSSKDRSVRRVDLCIEPGQSLGLMIRGGVEYNLGIFVTGVDKDSVADRAGLMVGDQILDVNGQSFMEVTHDEAVSQLKYHKRMSILVRDVGKVPHSCTAYDREFDLCSPGSRAAQTTRKWAAALQMVEEKARCILAKHEFTTLCYYTDEYSARHMTIDAFVQVMTELLNTPDKYTLMIELREIIAVEDRMKFDELVYRRDFDLPHVRDPRDNDYRHSRRKGDVNHSNMMMSSGYHEDYCGDDENGGRRHSSPGESRTGSTTALHQPDYPDSDQELAHKLSRSFDMKDDQSLLEGGGGVGGGLDGSGGPPGMRRHQSMQRLAHSGGSDVVAPGPARVVSDAEGNLRITVRKTKPILGIAIEGGANTKHPLPRIININENGAAYCAGGLEVGQLILQVDGTSVDGLQHQDVARLIAESFARRDRDDIEFLVVEAKKSNMEPKPTALIFLEA